MKKLHIVTGTVLALAISAHGYGQGSQLPKYTVATLPSAASYKSFTVQVIDGISDTDCTVGGATGTSAHNALCSAQWNGSAYVWVPVASGVQEVDTDTTSGISGGPITNTGTIHCLPSSITQFGCSKVDGTSITSTDGVYSASLTGSLEMQPPAPPITGQYVFVPLGSADLYIPTGGPFEVDDSVTLGPVALPSYIDPANVTAVYAVGEYTEVNFNMYNSILNGPGWDAFVIFNCGGFDLKQASTGLTGLTGATFGTATCFAKLAANYSGAAAMNIPMAGFYVYYNGPAPPADNTVKVDGPLYYNASIPQLGLTWPFDGALDTGTTDALTVTIPAGTPSKWSEVKVSAAHANTSTTPTLNVNGTGAIRILGPTGGALVAGDISTTVVARFIKNLDGYWILENPQVSSTSTGITALTGDVTATGPGSAAATLATVNSAPGTCGDATHVCQITTNGKGLTTAQTAVAITGGGGGGGYTNLAASATETTVAQVNAACGSGTYYATTPLSIATGGTITCPVQFAKAGLWTIATGQTVTFSQIITETDAPSQIFAGAGTVVFSQNQALAPIEWFGAVPYTSQALAAAGTDSTAAIQACLNALTSGQCIVAASYYRTTSVLSITKSNVGFKGTSTNGGGYGGSATPSVFVQTTAGADIIDVAGASNAAQIYGNKFESLSLNRSVTPTGTATGLSVIFAQAAVIDHVLVADSQRCFYLKSAGTNNGGIVQNNACGWGGNGISDTGTLYGFYLDALSVSEYSLRMVRNTVSNNGQGTTSYGFYIAGGAGTGPIDIMGDGNESAAVSYGTYVNGAGTDIHWNNSIDDSITTSCIYVTGAGQKTSTQFVGGWCNPATGAYGADIESSFGVDISHKQFFSASGATTAMIYAHSSSFLNFAHNTLASVPKVGIKLDGTGLSAIQGNQILTTSTTSQGLVFVNTSSGSTLQGNTIGGNAVSSNAAISFDATSASNTWAQGNTADTGAYPTFLSDLNGTNSLSATVAWGSITGTLSAQTDLQTALNAKASTASPTFTGTPAAPTAAPGTNTTQIATTAFVAAAVTGGGTAFGGGLGTSYQDVTEIAAPANPAAGNDRIYTNSTTHKLACLTSSGVDCMPSGGTSTKLLDNPIDSVPGSPTAWDDEFTGEAALPVKWTSHVGAGGSQQFLNSQVFYSYLPPVGSGQIFNINDQSLSGATTPWAFTVKLKNFNVPIASIASWAGLYISDGTKAMEYTYGWGQGSATVSTDWCTGIDGAPCTVSHPSTVASVSPVPGAAYIYLRLQDDGTNYNVSYSFDGITFIAQASQAVASYLGTPTKIGFLTGNANSGASRSIATTFGWFRKTQ
jgi:hypothetical protein